MTDLAVCGCGFDEEAGAEGSGWGVVDDGSVGGRGRAGVRRGGGGCGGVGWRGFGVHGRLLAELQLWKRRISRAESWSSGEDLA